ncbi:putative heterokaryon incompatibility protein [Botrytis fragariae]|uniref:Putative heterokaryon incompatibility protein n=1 Tax=Botrytis fragariae TaxID=1964551 RepID=A0A8H6AIZ2_9HELO|nr:putative heterokaryon incompatibility protein [Botrytis fragariae]KAF5868507.1 putative heterokaryon incompatibility protein [Botrytis fragariae]
MEEQHMQVPVKGSSDAPLGKKDTIVVLPKNSQENIISQFLHELLPDPKTFIRLLELDRIDQEDTTTELRCSISTWHVDHTPPYHAISYVWGSPEFITTINVDGRSLKININADYALRQAKWFGVRYVWMDSICIDQHDIEEKGDQVKIMGHIYRNASCVLACVGLHDDDSELVMKFSCKAKIFKPGMGHIDGASGLTVIKHTIESLIWAIKTQDVRKRRLRRAFFTFMDRPYFKRVWILQEVSAAGTVIICCGSDHRPISELYTLHHKLHSLMVNTGRLYSCNLLIIVAFLTMHRQEMTRASIVDWQDSRCDPASNSCWGYCADPRYRYLAYGASKVDQHFLLLPLLKLTRDLQCQDLRDKIYGVLSMVDWQDVLPIAPDYTADIFELAVLGMTRIIEQSKCSEGNCSEESCYQAALPFAYSLAQSMKLSLAHKNSESVDIHQHAERVISLDEPVIPYAEDVEWFSCKILRGTDNNWKLDVRPNYKFHKKHIEGDLGCMFHRDKSGRRPKLILSGFEGEIPEDYVKIMDDEGGLVALLPKATQQGDLLVTQAYAHFDRKEPTKIRYQMPRYLVLREYESSRLSIIGQAIAVGGCVASSATIGPWFDLQFGVRDALNLTISWAKCPAYQEKDLSLLTWTMAKELLDLKVCRDPLSSYASEVQYDPRVIDENWRQKLGFDPWTAKKSGRLSTRLRRWAIRYVAQGGMRRARRNARFASAKLK